MVATELPQLIKSLISKVEETNQLYQQEKNNIIPLRQVYQTNQGGQLDLLYETNKTKKFFRLETKLQLLTQQLEKAQASKPNSIENKMPGS